VIIIGPAGTTSPKDSRAAKVQQALVSISFEGRITRLTNLTALYSEIQIGNLSWSPDGRYIAFLLYAKPGSYPNLYPELEIPEAFRLAVYDSITQQVTEYCIPGYSNSSPVWSPDSKQVIINFIYSKLPNQVIMVDIEKNWAAKIAENVFSVGWLQAP
jgi:Tol biopolymer transport system component